MPDHPAAPSLARRLLALPLSLLQRARNLLLRPVRHELGDARREIEQLRAQAQADREALAGLRQGFDASGAREAPAQVEALRKELALLRDAVVVGEPRVRELARLDTEAGLDAAAQARATLARRLLLIENLVAALPSGSPGPATPLVSIVLPTRDRAACLAEAIESVLAQDYAHWELLVVDDDSRDQTRELVAGYLHDPRIRYEAVAHSGPSGARNHALRAARGELIAYLDSDNAWYPGFLSAAVAAFAADPALGLAYGALASEAHEPGVLRLLLDDFDRARLERANYIDLNTVVHRRDLYERLGGFDESLARAVDWDLLLRYTAPQPARALPVLAARYRVRDQRRVTDTVPIGPSWIAIRKKVDPVPVPPRAPRVLYVVWHYPQLSETYLEGEIRCLRRWGADIAVWREVGPVSPYLPSVPVHDGDLAKLVEEFRPDVIHIHWLGFALNQDAALSALGVPVTLRMHGFDTTPEQFRKLLATSWLERVYAFPRQLGLLDRPDARVRAVPAAFDTSFFEPAAGKDPRLVVRAGSCLPSKDIALFFELAKRVPSHRFVFAGCTCNEFEHYPEELRRLAADMQSPVDLRFDVPRADMAALLGRAGIYLHTIHPPHAQFGAPIGQPISIAEAMATGAYVLVRDLPELADYVGSAGATYVDAEDAARLIEETTQWSEEEWRARRVRASDRGFLYHADELVLRPIFDDWCELAARRDAAAGRETAGAA